MRFGAHRKLLDNTSIKNSSQSLLLDPLKAITMLSAQSVLAGTFRLIYEEVSLNSTVAVFARSSIVPVGQQKLLAVLFLPPSV